MPVRLVALDDGPDILMDRDPVVVGRHPSCDFRLPSIRVSRRHCCLTVVDGHVTVRDLGSTNGTTINGHRVETGRLRPGDELAFANLRYRLVMSWGARLGRVRLAEGTREGSESAADLPGTLLQDER